MIEDQIMEFKILKNDDHDHRLHEFKKKKRKKKVKNKIQKKDKYVLLLLLLVSELYASGQLVERLAVIELELGSLSKKILKLRHDGDLGLHPDVETSQLLVQLQSYI